MAGARSCSVQYILKWVGYFLYFYVGKLAYSERKHFGNWLVLCIIKVSFISFTHDNMMHGLLDPGLHSWISVVLVGCWAICCGMRFQAVKCNIMQITRKRIKVNASYSLEGMVLDNVEKIKYLGITITNNLKWNTVSNISAKANRTLGFIRRNLAACPQDVKVSLQVTGTSNPGVW